MMSEVEPLRTPGRVGRQGRLPPRLSGAQCTGMRPLIARGADDDELLLEEAGEYEEEEDDAEDEEELLGSERAE